MLDFDALFNKSYAYHEAGHAMVALVLGEDVCEISLSPNHCLHQGYSCDCHQHVNVIIAYAGQIANTEYLKKHLHLKLDSRYGGGGKRSDDDSDNYNIHDIKQKYPHVGSLQTLKRKTQQLVLHPFVWSGIDELAVALLEKGKLTKADVGEIVIVLDHSIDIRERPDHEYKKATESEEIELQKLIQKILKPKTNMG